MLYLLTSFTSIASTRARAHTHTHTDKHTHNTHTHTHTHTHTTPHHTPHTHTHVRARARAHIYVFIFIYAVLLHELELGCDFDQGCAKSTSVNPLNDFILFTDVVRVLVFTNIVLPTCVCTLVRYVTTGFVLSTAMSHCALCSVRHNACVMVWRFPVAMSFELISFRPTLSGCER